MITSSEGKRSVSSGPQDIRIDEAPAERRPRLSTRSRKASGPAQDAPTKAAPLSQRRFPFGPLGHNVRRLRGSPDGLLVAPFAGGDTFGERPASVEYVDRRFPARTKRGTRKISGPPIGSSSAGHRSETTDATISCRSSCIRRSLRRPVLLRCGATGCIWPYGRNGSSNRS